VSAIVIIKRWIFEDKFNFFRLPLSSENVMHDDHDYDVKALPLPEVEPPQKPAKVTETSNKKITEFFAVRRSVRKTKKEVQEERMRTIEQAIHEEREEGLEVELIYLV
jgi:hypothetical protein